MNKLKWVFAFLLGLVIIASSIEKSVAEIEASLIPKFRPFGTSTMFTDSTNYVQLLGKGLSIPNDSLRVGKDLYVGVKGGGIYLDTNRDGKISFSNENMIFLVSNSTGNISNYTQTGTFKFYNATLDSPYVKIDPNYVWIDLQDLVVDAGDIEFNNPYGTNQVKINGGDSLFTDYDSNDDITCNLQSGLLLTKSLTTGAGATYTLTLTNSLATDASRVFVTVFATSSAGIPIVTQCNSNTGSVTIVLTNIHGADALNNTIQLSFFVINSP